MSWNFFALVLSWAPLQFGIGFMPCLSVVICWSSKILFDPFSSCLFPKMFFRALLVLKTRSFFTPCWWKASHNFFCTLVKLWHALKSALTFDDVTFFICFGHVMLIWLDHYSDVAIICLTMMLCFDHVIMLMCPYAFIHVMPCSW